MGKITIEYQAKSKDQFESLEAAIKKLSSVYTINGSGTLLVSQAEATNYFGKKYVLMNPDKHSEVENISLINPENDKTNTTINTSTREQITFTIDKLSYTLYFDKIK